MKHALLVTTFLLACTITAFLGMQHQQAQQLSLSLNRIVDVGVSAENNTPSAAATNTAAPSPLLLAVLTNMAQTMYSLQTPMLYLAIVTLLSGLGTLTFISWDNKGY